MYHLSVLVHLISAMVWVGGMLFLALVVVPATRHLPPAERGQLFQRVGGAFRVVGWTCVGLLVLTGLIISGYRGVTWETLASGALLGQSFGQLLAAKVGLVVVMVLVTLYHDIVVGPASARALAEPATLPAATARAVRRQSAWLARASTLLALLVVALAVALVRGLPW